MRESLSEVSLHSHGKAIRHSLTDGLSARVWKLLANGAYCRQGNGQIYLMSLIPAALFMGRKAGKPFTAVVSGFFRRNHMYVFAWAMIYTF